MGRVLGAGPAGRGQDDSERSLKFRARSLRLRISKRPLFICRNGQVYETREGSVSPGWTLLRTQSSHREGTSLASFYTAFPRNLAGFGGRALLEFKN